MMKIFKTGFFLLFMLLVLVNCQRLKSPLGSEPDDGFWVTISTVSCALNKMFFLNPNNGWAVGDNGVIINTNNGGNTWNIQGSGTNSKLISLFFIDRQNGFAAGSDNTLLSTNNGGASWKIHHIQSDQSTSYSSIHSDDRGNLYFITNFGEIFRSENSGKDWNSITKFDAWGFSFLDFTNETVGFAMQFGGNELKKTTDRGNTWNTYQLPTLWIGDIFFLNSRLGWFTENWAPSSSIHETVSVFKTTDGGATWIRQTSLPGVFLGIIKFVDSDNGWLSQMEKIFHTRDGGKSWDCQFEVTQNGYIKDIFVLNDSNAWALTSQGELLKYTK